MALGYWKTDLPILSIIIRFWLNAQNFEVVFPSDSSRNEREAVGLQTDLVKKKSELLAVTRHLTAGVVNGTRHCRTRKTSQRRVDVGAIFSRMQQKSERQDAAGTEAASRRDGDSTDVGFVHEMKMEDGTTVEVHTGTMAEFTDMYEGRMSDGVGMEADSVIRDHVRDDRGTEDIVRGERTGDIVRDDRTEDIVRGDMEEDIVRGDMTEDIVKGDRTEDIVGGDRTEDIVGGDRTEDIVRGDMAEDIVRGDRTEDIVGGDRTEDIVRNLSTAAGWQTYSKELRTSGRNVSELKGWPHFERVFMVSALDGDGIWDIKVSEWLANLPTLEKAFAFNLVRWQD